MSGPQLDTASPGETPFFDVVLHPHRSLSARGFWILMAFVSVICFSAGIAFTFLGAWPVLGFLGLDVLAIYLAFRLSYRSGRMFETVKLGNHSLDISRVHPNGRIQRWSLAPNWLSVDVRDGNRGGVISLRSHGREVSIGKFLTEEEREALAEALRTALHDWRLAPHLKDPHAG